MTLFRKNAYGLIEPFVCDLLEGLAAVDIPTDDEMRRLTLWRDAPIDWPTQPLVPSKDEQRELLAAWLRSAMERSGTPGRKQPTTHGPLRKAVSTFFTDRMLEVLHGGYYFRIGA